MRNSCIDLITSTFLGGGVFPGVPEVEDYAAEDAGVCDVKGGPAIGDDQEVEEVDHVAKA